MPAPGCHPIEVLKPRLNSTSISEVRGFHYPAFGNQWLAYPAMQALPALGVARATRPGAAEEQRRKQGLSKPFEATSVGVRQPLVFRTTRVAISCFRTLFSPDQRLSHRSAPPLLLRCSGGSGRHRPGKLTILPPRRLLCYRTSISESFNDGRTLCRTAQRHP